MATPLEMNPDIKRLRLQICIIVEVLAGVRAPQVCFSANLFMIFLEYFCTLVEIISLTSSKSRAMYRLNYRHRDLTIHMAS